MIKSHFIVFLINACFSLFFSFFYVYCFFTWYKKLLVWLLSSFWVTSASQIIFKWNSDNSGDSSLNPLLSLLKGFFLKRIFLGKNVIFSKNISLLRVLYLIGKKLELYYLRRILALYLLNGQQVECCGGGYTPSKISKSTYSMNLMFSVEVHLDKDGCWCLA